jgi:hypothetical protein
MGIDTEGNNLFRYIHFKPARLTEKLKEKIKKDPARPDKGKREKKLPRDNKQKNRIERENLLKALKDLVTLDLTRDVNLNNVKDGPTSNTILTLNKNGLAKLSNQTSVALKSIELDPNKMSYFELVEGLNDAAEKTQDKEIQFTPAGPQPKGEIQAVGIAKLLVVKQQILRYEAAEIAHIENVLSGENKIRTHEQLTRSEEVFSSSNEKTTDTETELSTTERFELNKETSDTFQKDTELGLELTVSGNYGPTISFESNFNAGQTKSESESNEQSVDFSKDTINRSKERIVEKIATEQKSTLIREIRETNEHTLKNESPEGDHSIAIYQYVDKIYKSQVFDYGIRQMFDFMIPEPSSYLWYLKKNIDLQIDIEPPKKLEELEVLDYTDISRNNYLKLGAMYGVSDLPEPPDYHVTKRVNLPHGSGNTTEGGRPKTGVSTEVDIPKGYRPYLASITIMAKSDDSPFFSISIGETIYHYREGVGASALVKTSLDDGQKIFTLTDEIISIGIGRENTFEVNGLLPEEKLYINVYGYESANYVVNIEMDFYGLFDPIRLDFDILLSWRREVYGKLAEAYKNSLLQYQQELSFLTAEAEARDRDKVDFGAPPAVNKKLILTELKKHCLAIIRNEHVGTLVTDHTGEPPQFNIADAREDGEIIRFLEHAFEWGQIQYVFYPYFWARPESDMSGWIDRFTAKNKDYTMEEFLKAGYARVVVPVREGFDLVVSYFIKHGKPYGGLGEPSIEDPLYRSITDEIKERTGAGKGEIPVGKSWETRLPTAAVIVKKTSTLPEWVKQDGEDWVWEPKDN